VARDRAQSHPVRLLCCALVLAGVLDPCRGATDPPATVADAAGEPATLIQRGTQLRDTIIATYRRWRKSHALPTSVRDRRDLRRVVATYLPAGGSLYQDEAVLRAAGCGLYRGTDGHVFATLQLGKAARAFS
jgi:hypothetical protein